MLQHIFPKHAVYALPCLPCSVEFAVDVPTLAAGPLCGGRRIAQVFPQGVRLLGERKHNIVTDFILTM